MDTVGHLDGLWSFGGVEFAVLVKSSTPTSAPSFVVERLLEALHQPIRHMDGKAWRELSPPRQA